ncbi:tetratricopeptide repeat protein [Pseudomonas helleri]|uniref:tetratricopeptide repeat protein n=1 Tax=Pseudomonas helleri TaxID=1608996 RepID=UPI00242FB43E|nr:tetratricopeptide repeat protein [Pseudomonas helleri]
MNKWWIPAVSALALLNGCASVPQGSIPVVDSGVRVSNSERVSAQRTTRNYPQATAPRAAQTQAIPQDSGVVVMVPGGGAAVSTPIQTQPITPGPITLGPAAAPISTGSYAPTTTYTAPAPITPSGIPSSSGGLAADEQLDGPVLALLTTAQQQQASGDLNGASSSLERAQRVAPREPQVLYRLAEVRMAQGDAAQAEQFARRGLTFASGRPDLQASLWGLIAQARDKQGDAAGAALARQKAR